MPLAMLTPESALAVFDTSVKSIELLIFVGITAAVATVVGYASGLFYGFFLRVLYGPFIRIIYSELLFSFCLYI